MRHFLSTKQRRKVNSDKYLYEFVLIGKGSKKVSFDSSGDLDELNNVVKEKAKDVAVANKTAVRVFRIYRDDKKPMYRFTVKPNKKTAPGCSK